MAANFFCLSALKIVLLIWGKVDVVVMLESAWRDFTDFIIKHCVAFLCILVPNRECY